MSVVMSRLAVLLLMCAVSSLKAETYRYAYSETIHVPPYDEQLGGPDGYLTLLLDSVAGQLGIGVIRVPVRAPMEAMVEALVSSVRDGRASFSALPDNLLPQDTLFHIVDVPAYEMEIGLVKMRDNPLVFHRWQDLAGRAGGYWAGFVHQRLLAKYGAEFEQLALRQYADDKALAAALINGEIDYAVAVTKPLLMQLHLQGYGGKYAKLGASMDKIPIHLFMRRDGDMYARAKELAVQFEFYSGAGRDRVLLQQAMRHYFLYMKREGTP